MLKTLKYVMRTKRFQPLWERVFKIALYGLNMGPVNIEKNGERNLIGVLSTTLPPDAVLFDVGANKGDYAGALAQHFPGAQIFAFEPSASTFATLVDVIAAENVRAENFGFSDSSRLARLYCDSRGSALASVYKRDLSEYGIHHGRHVETIRLRRVDEYCREAGIDRIDLLKLDVEGHELAVLRGCGDMLASGKVGTIQFEFGGCNIDSGAHLRDFYQLLFPRYHFFRMVADGLVPLGHYSEVYEKYGTNNLVATNNQRLLHSVTRA